MATLPRELQRMAKIEALRAAIEVRDFAAATQLMNDFEAGGIRPDIEPAIRVLAGRLHEGLGRNDDALADYRFAAASSDRRAAAQGRLREIALMHAKGDMSRKAAITALETLIAVWRGDETETEGLQLLAHLYTEEGRYRDAFHVMRTALRAHPNSDLTRKIQDEAAATFDSLFLEGKGDTLPPVEALGLFYDYRELTPIGRRGDEMIRKLADRLVSVDLLDQAAELLQHQVDNRLQGAARAQIATKLAVIYLMNRRPERALATLQSTRTGDLSNELRDQRLLLEARALSDIGRHELALELIANIKGREAIRLRSDIMWAAKRWRDAAEQIELLHGERWREFTPLNDTERSDILRAAIGYTLGDESMGLDRLREKYGAKMAESPDARAFEVVSSPIGNERPEFMAIAKRLAAVDTLQAFLRDIRKRYPDAAPSAIQDRETPPAAAPKPAVTAPSDKPVVSAPATADPVSLPLPPKAPAGVPLRPDMSPTGSVPAASKPRPAAR
jgi:tetratricopeptide (TPR) repeat protein